MERPSGHSGHLSNRATLIRLGVTKLELDIFEQPSKQDLKSGAKMQSPHYSREHVNLNAGMPVRAVEINNHPDVMTHDHSFHEIVVVTAGSAIQSTREGDEKLKGGTALILQPESSHSYRQSRHFDVINIYYLAEWFLTDVNALRGADHLFSLFFGSALFERQLAAPIVRLDLEVAEFENLKFEMAQLIQGEAENRSLLYREACFLKILDELSRVYGRTFGRDQTRPVRVEVLQGLEAIERQAAKGEFLIAEASRQAGLSVNQFERLFRSHTGMKPIDYFQKIRLNHVCRRLLNSGASIAEVAYEFNYSDAAHLNRYFRRFLKMTPGQYRKTYAS